MPDRQLSDRTHPCRLAGEDYQMFGQSVFYSLCAKPGIRLDDSALAPTIIATLGHMGKRYGVTIHAYCIMPDHLHVMASLSEDRGDFQKWIRYSKRETARILRQPGMWQRSYWDRHLRKDEDVETAVYYVLNNPVRRELSDDIFDWPYSWSRWHPQTRGPNPNGGA
ncbi:MAG: transposase, partial [Armatimonadia bacterium]